MWNKPWWNSLAAGQGAEVIGQREMLLTMLAALLIHLLALYGWHLMPKLQVVDIPVHALNIKLGDSDSIEAVPVATPEVNNQDVENTISRLVRNQSPDNEVRERSVTRSMDKAMNHNAAKTPVVNKDSAADALDQSIAPPPAAAVPQPAARQFVRENNGQVADQNNAPAPAGGEGSHLGNSTAKDAEMVSRYEQLISLWIQKFKLYPPEARAQHMQGETVVRVRIDRRGNIRYYTLERSTGYRVLDHAAIDMIRRANPVPAVPSDYPDGELLEFLIPVSFKLQ